MAKPYGGGSCPICDVPAVRQLPDNAWGQPQYTCGKGGCVDDCGEDELGDCEGTPTCPDYRSPHRWFTAFKAGQERPRQAVLPLAGEE